MTNAKHTPGPWEALDTTVWCNSRRGSWVGVVANTRTANTDGCDAANARLIAAAPDLLAACEALLAAYERADEVGGLITVDARAAIARATGDAS